MNNTKVKELETRIVDSVCDDWKDKEVKSKLNELRILVTKYMKLKS